MSVLISTNFDRDLSMCSLRGGPFMDKVRRAWARSNFAWHWCITSAPAIHAPLFTKQYDVLLPSLDIGLDCSIALKLCWYLGSIAAESPVTFYRAMRSFEQPISWDRDFPRSGHCLVNALWYVSHRLLNISLILQKNVLYFLKQRKHINMNFCTFNGNIPVTVW